MGPGKPNGLVDGRMVRVPRLLARLGFIVLGCYAAIWAVLTLPLLPQAAVIERTGAAVKAGEAYRPDDLAKLMPAMAAADDSGFCRPASVQAVVVIRLRVLELAFAGETSTPVDTEMAALRRSLRVALACSPTDGFLWMVDFWLANTENGFSPENLALLRLSYRYAPNEGWIALKRNRLALALYDQLPADLQRQVLAEFADLLASGFVDDAVKIIEGPGWLHRGQLLPRLADVSEGYRAAFARALYDDGYDAEVPGIEKPEPRPWH